MIKILIGYWILTTIAGVYWMIKNPSDRRFQDEEFSLLEVIAFIFPCACIAWAIAPMMLLHKIKFKR